MSTQAVERRTGWVGWIYFAGIIMLIAGTLNIINGVIAVFNPDWVVFTSRETLLLSLSGWGWLHILLGIIVFASGIGVFSGNVAARSVGVIGASFSVIANFVYLPAYPLWSIIIIAMDVFVIWALVVHGDEMRR